MHRFNVTRRDFLRGTAGAAALFMLGCQSEDPLGIDADGTLTGTGKPDPFAGGTFEEAIAFVGEGSFPTGVRQDQGLDGRLALDLSDVDALTVPNEDFFIRSFPPPELPSGENWAVKIGGLVDKPVEVPIQRIRELSGSRGSVVMECAGNGKPLHFGLMSAADWSGVPITKILEMAQPKPEATRVLISGFEGTQPPSTHSTPGASWVFTPEQLAQTGAFLAVEMNGAPLTADHGAPVRLVVPGWFGCTCVKWLNEIKYVDDDTPATAQMLEFAKRTHQDGVPELARDYLPAAIDRTAVPIRVERWRVDGKTLYRVVGLTWGAAVEPGQLGISCKAGDPFEPVTACGELTSGSNWAFWSHRWEPAEPGEYRLRLKLLESDAPTRRLDMRWYVRRVQVEQVG